MNWQAVCLSKNLKTKPVRLIWEDAPIVIFRTDAGVQALIDRCPHRFASFSKGRVVGENIECPYHGWQFSGEGRLAALPGCVDALGKYKVQRFHTHEVGGIIFLAKGATAPNELPRLELDPRMVTHHLESQVEGELAYVAENILDVPHTYFTHKNFLRGLSAQSTDFQVDARGGDDFVELEYIGETAQDGMVSRLFESGTRHKSVARYSKGGLAELEFWGDNGLRFHSRMYLRQESKGRVVGVGILNAPRQFGLGYLKKWAFLPIFRIVLGQDQRMLKDCAGNNPAGQKPIIGPIDYLIEDIWRINKGERPALAGAPWRRVLSIG